MAGHYCRPGALELLVVGLLLLICGVVSCCCGVAWGLLVGVSVSGSPSAQSLVSRATSVTARTLSQAAVKRLRLYD